MSWRIIRALVIKDIKIFFRDKFFGVMTIFAMALYIVIYFLMPSTMNETIEIGLYVPHAANLFGNIPEHEALIVRTMETEDELKQSIIDKKLYMGISVPDDVLQSVMSGEKPKVFAYYSSEMPDEMKEMYTIFLSEMINEMSGHKLNIDDVEIVLGPDMGGRQIPYSDRMIPLLAFMIIIMETFGLANLIASEVEKETVQALLATPMKVVDLFVGKGITGVSLAFVQVVLFFAVTGSLTRNISLVMLSLLLGSIMVTGLAFLIASISRDLMSVVGWGTLLVIVLGIPAVSIIFPGPVSGWIKVIPSFYLVDTLHRAVNFDIGWNGNATNVLSLVGFNIVFITLGIMTLKRKLA